MSSDKPRSLIGDTRCNRGRVREHSLQSRQEVIRSSNEQVREGHEETDWRLAFKVLASCVGKSWFSSDALTLMAYSMVDAGMPEEALKTYMDHVGLNRSKSVHNFMG